MSANDLSGFIKYLRDRAYNLEKRQGKAVKVTVDFVTRGRTTRKMENVKRQKITEIDRLAAYESPEFISVWIKSDEMESEYSHRLTTSDDKIRRENRNDDEKRPLPENSGFENRPRMTTDEMEAIISRSLEEARRKQAIEDLQKEVIAYQKQLTQIQSEKDDLELELTEKEQRIDELEDEIKTKNSIKFYAGLAGDVLESIGIKKSMLKKSLAGIMKSNPSEHSETTSENTTSLPDNSGIVDDDTPETQTGKRSEMINLIREYLPTTRDDVLTNIFAIFSEIEQDGELSYRLLKYIEEEKE